ncbi:MAG: hypothetical protein IRY95_03730, partial [Clostridia bacterium]|nr:hypothetical protein [Clostridia bacterium]
VHPHLQALAGPVASTRLRTLEVALRRHAEREGSDYWSDLLAAERADGARYLGRTGAVEWVVAFAPRAMAEVVGVLEHCTWVGDLGEAELADVAAGLDRVLRYYERMAVHGFNVSLYPGLRPSPHFRVHVRVVARHYAGTLGVNDMNYLQVLQDEAWTLRRPEDVAAELKGFFGAGGVTGDGEEGGGGACSTS